MGKLSELVKRDYEEEVATIKDAGGICGYMGQEWLSSLQFYGVLISSSGHLGQE